MDNDVQPMETSTTKERSGLLIVLTILMVLGLGIFYVVGSGMFDKKATVPTVAPVPEPPSSEVIQVEYTYEVASIEEKVINLMGERGNFKVPVDPTNVTVYNGPTKDSPTMLLSQVKVGDKVNVEFVPGQSIALFIL